MAFLRPVGALLDGALNDRVTFSSSVVRVYLDRVLTKSLITPIGRFPQNV